MIFHFKTRAKFLLATLAIIGILLGLFVPSTLAYYGEGSYGECDFNDPCSTATTEDAATTTPATEVATDDIQVTINLTDGQQLTQEGYVVIVTPAEGDSFSYAEFYVDDVLQQTVEAGDDGSARWFWDTRLAPGTTVRIDLFDENDKLLLRKSFNVTITDSPAPVVTQPTTPPEPTAAGSSFKQSVKVFLELLPPQVVVSIPYALLSILFVTILILMGQTRRELGQIELLKQHLGRAKQLAEQKNTFVDLTSHYLRTPATLLGGGADFLATTKPPLAPQLLNSLKAATQNLGSSVERLLGSITNNPNLRVISSSQNQPPPRPAWARPAFWLPIGLIGLLIVIFNVLLAYAETSALITIDNLTQLALLVGLAIVLYSTTRRYHLYKHNLALVQNEVNQQATIDQARNELIVNTATTLAQRTESIKQLLPQIQDGPAKKFVAEGYQRINDVLRRFHDVALIEPPAPSADFVSLSSDQLFDRATSNLQGQIAAKQLRVSRSGHFEVSTQRPEWVTQTIQAVLDNAIAYSPQGSQIALRAAHKGDGIVLSITDSGPSIPAEKLGQMFKPFFKVEGAMHFDHPGLGLSLYTGQLFMQSLGGSITLESQSGEGLTVNITLPA